MLCNATLRSTSHCIACINICQMLIQFEIFSGDELNKPMASVQILLLLYTTYSMYITCVIEIKYVYTKLIPQLTHFSSDYYPSFPDFQTVANPIIGNKQTRVMLQILPQLKFTYP